MKTAKMKSLEVTIEQGLVGFCNNWLYNPQELGVSPEYIHRCFKKVSREYNYNLSWLKIYNALCSKGIDPSFSILNIAMYLFELNKKGIKIESILKSMDKNAEDPDHLFHDFSVIKIGYSYSQKGHKVEFVSDRDRVDLIIDGLKVEVKRRMGFLKDKKFKTGKAFELFRQGIHSRAFRNQIKKAFNVQKADALIYDITTDIGRLGIPFLITPEIHTNKPPKLQTGSMVLFSSFPNGEMKFIDMTKENEY